MDRLPRDGGHPVQQSGTDVHLPIEGVTAWPQIQRLVAIASCVLVLLLSCTFLIWMPEQKLDMDPDKLMMGLICILIFEMVIVRRLIIPMNGDYGRYRINETTVDFYPLSTLGLRVLTRPQSIPMHDFSGIALQIQEARGSTPAQYAVALIHPQRANMIRIRFSASRVEAESYAGNLCQALKLPMLPPAIV